MVFSVDSDVAKTLSQFNNTRMIIVSPKDYETSREKALKKERTLGEYCWTMKPLSIFYIFNKFSNVNWVTYLDADMMVCSNLDEITDKYKNFDVILTPHNESHHFFSYDVKIGGKFNAGYVAFKKTKNAINILKRWKSDCYTYMVSTPNNGCYGDQKYLEQFEEFEFVYSDSIEGLNTAPWNIHGKQAHLINNSVHINGKKLYLYHMQGLRPLSYYFTDIYSGHFKINMNIYKMIYLPYIYLLREVSDLHLRLGKNNMIYYYKISYFVLLREIIKFVKRNSNIKYVRSCDKIRNINA